MMPSSYPMHQRYSLNFDSSSPAPESTLRGHAPVPPMYGNQELAAHAAGACRVSLSQIEDIMPCTALQEAMMSHTAMRPGDYVVQFKFEIGTRIDMERLRECWAAVVQQTPIMRTRLVSLPYENNMRVFQVVIQEAISWHTGPATQEMDGMFNEDEGASMKLGQCLSEFYVSAKVSRKEAVLVEAQRFLVWRAHHCLFDDWSLSMITKQVEDLYHDRSPRVLLPMRYFVENVVSFQTTPAQRDYWAAQFKGIKPVAFPEVTAGYCPRADSQLVLRLAHAEGKRTEFTPATIFKAAWAAAIASVTGKSEAIFGLVVTGRQCGLEGIEDVAGPTIATVPVAVRLNWQSSVRDLLEKIQIQAADMIPFEQTGMRNIAKLSPESLQACKFQSLLVVQMNEKKIGEQTPDTPAVLEMCNPDASYRGADPYAIVVEIQPSDSGADVLLSYDSNVIDSSKIRTMSEVFCQAAELAFDTDGQCRNLEHLRHESQSMSLIRGWNSKVPKPTPGLVHDLIRKVATRHPFSTAIDAWDGHVTYRDLDRMSSQLAHWLSCNNASGTILPLLFEKSKWMPIVAVAVMKAGGACMALDVTQPEQRLASLIDSCVGPLVICSPGNLSLAQKISNPTFHRVTVIGPEAWLFPDGSLSRLPALPTVPDTALLYASATSGSSGTPKRALITHSNFVAAIFYQQNDLEFCATSRVLDFASYAFDACWANLIHSLTSGACLCIPSQQERDNCLDLCFSRYHINLVDLTPSLARSLPRDCLTEVTTLQLGGEAVQSTDAGILGFRTGTRVINVYGPAECTPTVAFAELVSGGASFGRGQGVCTWVVDVKRGSLAEIGAVGELWIEGPLVGAGYLGLPAETEAAFIRNPPWLTIERREQPGTESIVYRTGDLVRYQPGGTLVFCGRADNQVKINGQRIELEDVESQIASILATMMTELNINVVVEVLQSRQSTKLLCAFLCTPHLEGNPNTEPTIREDGKDDTHIIADLKAKMETAIPRHMIPSLVFSIASFPMTPSGKIDRKRLREMGQRKALKEDSGPQDATATHAPISSVEATLRRVWMSVLNLTEEEMPITRAFFRAGGDSISAMQIVAQCRPHNLQFSVSDLLEASTIQRLAARCKVLAASNITKPSHPKPDTGRGELFPLSPIQQMFFETYPDGLDHWNQSFLLQLRRNISLAEARSAVLAVVKRHDMLRCRFQKHETTGHWQQYISGYEEGSMTNHFFSHDVETLADINAITQTRQTSLSLRHGPVFACDLFNISGDPQILLLTAHHAVIDLVSWRILWDEIEHHIKYSCLPTEQTTSFRSWVEEQSLLASTQSPTDILPQPLNPENIAFWGINPSENTFSSIKQELVSLDRETTTSLFGPSNEAVGSTPIDIISGVLLYTFIQSFPEREAPTIWVEGHGRGLLEATNPSLDVSSTVGWLTNISPLPLALTLETTAVEAIRLAKDERVSFSNARSHFLSCRYFSRSGSTALQGHEVTEIMFNFLGRFQQLEGDDGLFQDPDPSIAANLEPMKEISPAAVRFSMIDIIAEVSGGKLNVTFEVHREMQHQARVRKWIRDFQSELRNVTRALLDESRKLTLSDVALAQLSYRQLDVLLNHQLPSISISASNVQDIYPCSPMQRDILLSIEKQAASYATFSVWVCTVADGCPSSLSETAAKICTAWCRIVARHTVLRSIFTTHPGSGDFLQVVLSKCEPRTNIMTANGVFIPKDLLERMDSPGFEAGEPQHMLTVCYEAATGAIAFRLDISHALMDAYSVNVMLKELCLLFDGKELASPAPEFKSVIEHVSRIPKQQSNAKWAEMLRGVKPCHLATKTTPAEVVEEIGIEPKIQPVSFSESAYKDLRLLCKEFGTTTTVFLHVVWAMVLYHFTGRKDVCFGYLAGGRDAPIAGINNLVGPLASLLIGRVDLCQPAKEVLSTTSQTCTQQWALHHSSLADIQHCTGARGSLFNTIISSNISNDLSQRWPESSLKVEAAGSQDNHEFDVSLTSSIGKGSMELSVDYNPSKIEESTALDIADTVHRAVDFLIETCLSADSYSPRSNEPLADAFFAHILGNQEEFVLGFWKHQLALGDMWKVSTNSTSNKSNATGCKSRWVQLDVATQQSAGTSSLGSHGETHIQTTIVAACSLVIARQLHSNEAVFGVQQGKAGSSKVLPWRTVVDPGQSCGGFIEQISHQLILHAKYSKIPRTRLRELDSGGVADKGLHIVLQTNASAPPVEKNQHTLRWFLDVDKQLIHLEVEFHPESADGCQTSGLLGQLTKVLGQLLDPSLAPTPLASISALPDEDLAQIWTWNSALPAPICKRTFDFLSAAPPSAIALRGWDGTLTYHELDLLSSALANYIFGKGVRQGDVVPLVFEKSIWYHVASFAVAKIGAAAVGTDTARQFEHRLQAVVKHTGGSTCLCSATSLGTACKFFRNPIVVGAGVAMPLPVHTNSSHLPDVSSSDIAYVTFTSGSSGTPKAAMVSHLNICTAVAYQAKELGFHAQCNVLDFSSYGFDVSWSNVLMTVSVGGCLVIPSEDEFQMGIQHIIKNHCVEIIDMTPSVARQTKGLEGLKTLILGGEVVHPADFTHLGRATSVIVAYGPAECTPNSTLTPISNTNSANIGSGAGVCTWVVDVADTSRLVPVGAPGELWLEGPLVGAGYLHDQAGTDKAFVENPPWLARGRGDGLNGRRGRLYRTGDLVQYASDGTLLFLGRIDAQVKLRGQRIDLDELEQTISRTILDTQPVSSGDFQVVCDLAHVDKLDREVLVAYVSITGHELNDHDDAVRDVICGVRESLEDILPSNTIPSYFIPIPTIPRTLSGKVSRKCLRSLTSTMSVQAFASFGSRQSDTRRQPRTDVERKFQEMYAAVTDLSPADVSIDDNFFRIGGDSLAAMKLVSMARHDGIAWITVKDLFLRPKIAALVQGVDN